MKHRRRALRKRIKDRLRARISTEKMR